MTKERLQYLNILWNKIDILRKRLANNDISARVLVDFAKQQYIVCHLDENDVRQLKEKIIENLKKELEKPETEFTNA